MDNVKAAAEQAYNTIVAKLAAPYFFEKLAANGVAPRSEKEAAEMWSVAQKLHVLYAVEQEKAAAANVSALTVASNQLDALLGVPGAAVTEKAAAWDDVARAAANQADIASAVLTLQSAAALAASNAE